MTELKFKYRVGKCTNFIHNEDYCYQCHTWSADVMGCKGYDNGKTQEYVIPFGDCIHADFDYKYKSVNVKNFECEYYEDNHNQHLNCILLKIGNKEYECEYLFIDGVEVYKDKYDG